MNIEYVIEWLTCITILTHPEYMFNQSYVVGYIVFLKYIYVGIYIILSYEQ